MSYLTPEFWSKLARSIHCLIDADTVTCGEGQEQVIMAEAARMTWTHLANEKYQSKDRFRSMEDFIHAAEKDDGIIKIERGVKPGEYFLETNNLEWRALTIFNFTSTKSLIDISVKGGKEHWYGTYSECVLESLEIMKDIDALVPEFRRIMDKERIEVLRESAISSIEKTTSDAENLPYDLRRKVRCGEFVYLVDDSNGTAWISRGNTSETVYTIPKTVVLEGKTFNIKSVEICAYDNSPSLEELIIPDHIEYLDGDSFLGCKNLRKVHIGKGLQHYSMWTFLNCPIEEIVIDPGNRFIKVSEDGNFILSKDGTRLLYVIRDNRELTIPDGVTEICECAVSFFQKLEKIVLPTTLKKVGPTGICHNKNLREIILPPSADELGTQALCENPLLETVDFPEGFTTIGSEVLMNDTRISKLILRSKSLVNVEDFIDLSQPLECSFDEINQEFCTLLVPQGLVDAYKEHPLWSSFKEIVAITEE